MMHNEEEVYKLLEDASANIQEFLDTHQINSAHAALMLQLEDLNNKMYDFDLASIKKQSFNLIQFNHEIEEIKQNASCIIEELDKGNDLIKKVAQVASALDKLLTQLKKLSK
jgi:hypothetical protein